MDRESLIKDLELKFGCSCGCGRFDDRICTIDVADYIIADRKRIVDPLYQAFDKIKNDESIDEFEQHDLITNVSMDEVSELAILLGKDCCTNEEKIDPCRGCKYIAKKIIVYGYSKRHKPSIQAINETLKLAGVQDG